MERISPVALAARVDYFRGPMNTKLISDRVNEGTGPWVLRLSDGTRVPVVHPDFIAITPEQIIVVAEDEISTTRIDPWHVVAIEELPAKSKRNGGKH